MRSSRGVACGVAIALLTFPFMAFAFPFGGDIGQIIFCYNDAIWVQLGPPVPGPYVWTPSTKTYEFGPPSHSGQWLLGLASPPYYCLVSIVPIIVYTGTAITMMGSSGPAAPAYTPSTPSSPGQVQYPQFTTAQQYDNEEQTLRSEYQSCIAAGNSGCETYTEQADAVAAERVVRFGKPTVTCTSVQGDTATHCTSN